MVIDRWRVAGTKTQRKVERTKDDVLAVEPRGDNGGHEELGAVRVRAGVGHREEVGAVVLELEVLICIYALIHQLPPYFPLRKTKTEERNAPANFSP